MSCGKGIGGGKEKNRVAIGQVGNRYRTKKNELFSSFLQGSEEGRKENDKKGVQKEKREENSKNRKLTNTQKQEIGMY